MPAKFHTVSPSIWDRTMRQLGGPAKVVRYYIQTCPTRLSEGLFQLPLGIIVFDTGLSEEHVRQGLAQLEDAGIALYDEDAEVILDRTALKTNPLRNGTSVDKETGEVKTVPDNRIAGAVRMFEQVPDTPLREEFYRLAVEFSPDLAQRLGERFPSLTFAMEAPSEPLASPSEAPSRDELDTSESEGSGCSVGGCTAVPAFEDGDGALLCADHPEAGFGEVVPLRGVA